MTQEHTAIEVTAAEMRAFAKRYEDTMGLTRDGAIRRIGALHDGLLDFADRLAQPSITPAAELVEAEERTVEELSELLWDWRKKCGDNPLHPNHYLNAARTMLAKLNLSRSPVAEGEEGHDRITALSTHAEAMALLVEARNAAALAETMDYFSRRDLLDRIDNLLRSADNGG